MRRRLINSLAIALVLTTTATLAARWVYANGCDWFIVDYVWNGNDYEPVWAYLCWEDPPPPDPPPPDPPPPDPPPPDPPPPDPPPPDPSPCSFSVSPTSTTVGPENGSISFDIWTDQGCEWSASPSSNFVYLTSASTGSGSASVTYGVENYTAYDEPRYAVLTIAGQTVTVTQPALPPPGPPPSGPPPDPSSSNRGGQLTLSNVAQVTGDRPANTRLSGSGISIEPFGGVCNAWIDDFPGVYLIAEVRVWGPDGELGSARAEGYGSVIATREFTHAKTGEYRCEYSWNIDGISLGPETETRSVYLIMLDITINTFIPDSHYPTSCIWQFGFSVFPTECGWTTGHGDGRGFARYGSSRTWQAISLYAPRSTDSLSEGYVHDVGWSALYQISTSVDASNRLTEEAKNDWIPGVPLKVRWAQGSPDTLSCAVVRGSAVEMTLACSGNEGTPLFWVAPGITYQFFVDFTFTADGRIEYRIRGQHDGFPDYEIYVGNQRIFGFHYPDYGQTILSLVGSGEFPVPNVTGEVQ